MNYIISEKRINDHQSNNPISDGVITLVRAARIELASLAWKAGILAIIRRPQTLDIIPSYLL